MAAPVNSVGKRQHASNKRSIPDKTDENVSSKKPRVNESFGHIEFKSYLKEPQMAKLGFEKFVQAATNHTDGGKEDVVLKYLHSSPECSEIFQVLEIQQKKVHELQLIFKCLEKILLRIADDLGQFYKTGQSIVKKLLAGHVLSIFNTLNVKNKSNQIKTSLKLLIAMVMLGGPSTKLVLNNVDLSHKSMLPLLQRRDVKDEEDVRTCFIHLIVACLLAGDNDAVKKLVQTKGLFENVFCGVEFDRVNTLQLLLSTILEKVIMNTAISKTAKVHMFSEKGLKELGRLYNWQGLAKWKQTLKQKGKQPDNPYMEADDTREDKDLVSEIVHKFLTEVCTSYKHGIIFHDKTYGLSARSQNHLMTRFLGNLCHYLTNDLVKELVIGILTACPDQLQYFLTHFTDSLVPRMTKKWIDSMDFLINIFNSIKGHIPILHMKEKKSVGNIVQILLMFTTPTSQILRTILPGVKDKSLVVNHVTLGLVKQMADTAAHVLKLLQNLTTYTPNENLAIQTMYKALVIKNLPDVMDMMHCLDRILQATAPDDIDKVQEFCGIGLCEVMIQMEQILCSYQDFQPTLLAEHPTILGKLIEGIMEKEWHTVSSDSYHLMKVHLLKLMAGTESRRLPWAKQNKSGQSLLHQLLAMLTQLSANAELADTTLQLVCKLLESTDQFENHHRDLVIWLNALLHSQTDVLDFVSKVMITYIHNPYPYMDRMCDLQLTSDLNLVSASEEKQPLDLSAMDLKSLDMEVCESSSKDVQRFPFCPILIVGLDILEKLETVPKEIQDYISLVALGTFHQQAFPEALCNLLAKYRDSLFLPGLLDYILTWIKSDVSATDILPTKSMYENFLSKNPDFVSKESSPLFIIQQDLLHLSYLIKHAGKMDGKRCVKEMKRLKKSIISNVQQLFKMELDLPRANKVNDEIPVESGEDNNTSVLYLAVRTVLESSVCKEFFLNEETKNQSSKFGKLMTDLVTEVVQLSYNNDLKLEDCVSYYHEAILSSLRTSQVNFSRFLKVLPMFVSTFTASQCKQVLQLVLNGAVYESEDNNLLMKVLEIILPSLTQSCVKCVTLTENGLYNFVNCFASVKHSLDILIKFLKKFPILSAQCSERTIEKVFEMTGHAELVTFLLENNESLKVKVAEILQATEQDWTKTDNIKILTKIIQLESGKNVNETKMATKKAVKMVWSQLVSICEDEPVDNIRDLKQLAELLITKDIKGEKLSSEMKKRLATTLETNVDKVRQHHIDLLHMLHKPNDIQNLLHMCGKCLMSMYETEGIDADIQEGLISILAEYPVTDRQTAQSEYWLKLAENIIKYSFASVNSLKFVTSFVQLLQKHDSGVVRQMAAMVTEHPLFLRIMFGEHGQYCKDLLVGLMLIVTECCPSSCHGDHIEIFLGAYRASLSITDQKILKLMQLYEKNGISSDSRSFLWGEKAVEQHMLRQSLGPSLKQTSMIQVMANIDVDMMSNSILLFPLRRKLHDLEPCEAEEYKSESKCYDPCFILPLLSHLLQPESVIECRRLIHTGCLGYTVAALSSHDENMRTLSQHILDKFQNHLEAARVPEKEQLMYMLQVIQTSIPKTTKKLSSIITQFLARAVKLMLKPDDHMYTIINQFLLLKPNLDIGNIPEFFKLFNSSAMQYQVERNWILSLMKDGLRESADYWIFEKRFTFKLLQCFYDSNMADLQSQLQVLKIVMAACKERRLAVDLCQNHGLLAWIAAAAYKLSSDKVDLCTTICNLLHQVWTTVMGESREEVRSIQLSFSTQMLACLKTLLPHISNIAGKVKLQFGRNLSSVLKYLSSVEKKIRGHVRHTLSLTELLIFILHCQSNLAVDKNLTNLIKTFVHGSFLGLEKEGLIKTKSGLHNIHNENINKSFAAEETELDSNEGLCLTEEIIKILEQLKPSTDRRTESCVGEILIVRWIIDLIGTVKNLPVAYSMVKQLHVLLLNGEDNQNVTLRHIACTDDSICIDLFDILNLYSIISQLYWSESTKDIQLFQDDFHNMVELLNNVLTGIYRLKFGLSHSKMGRTLEKQLKNLKVSGDDSKELVKSLALQQMFVAKL